MARVPYRRRPQPAPTTRTDSTVATDDKRRTKGGAPPVGGNTPKPPNGSGRSAKDARDAKAQSKAQSRPVSTKAPAGPRGGNRPRPTGRSAGGTQGRPMRAPGRRLSGPVLAWGSVGLVVVIVVVLVVINSLGSSKTAPSGAPTPVTPAPAAVVRDVTHVPASVFNTVGVNIPSAAQPAKPIVLSGQPPLTLSGKTPAMLYYGAEYCPFCAAQRWSMTVALARFGTFSGLDVTRSSGTDVYPLTPTFSYRDTTYTSPYLSFFPIEQYTNIPAPNGNGGYTVLENPSSAEQKVIDKYSSPTYVPGAQAGSVSFPFVDVDNKVLLSGASYSPGILAGMSHAEVASSLSDPHGLVTQAIVGTANEISAAICASTGQRPATVCTSPGVKAADRALKLG